MQPPTTPPTIDVVAGPELSGLDFSSPSLSESELLSDPAPTASVGSALADGAALIEMVSTAPVAVVIALGTGVEVSLGSSAPFGISDWSLSITHWSSLHEYPKGQHFLPHFWRSRLKTIVLTGAFGNSFWS